MSAFERTLKQHLVSYRIVSCRERGAKLASRGRTYGGRDDVERDGVGGGDRGRVDGGEDEVALDDRRLVDGDPGAGRRSGADPRTQRAVAQQPVDEARPVAERVGHGRAIPLPARSAQRRRPGARRERDRVLQHLRIGRRRVPRHRRTCVYVGD